MAARRREAFCRMLDGTVQLVRVAGWQQDADGRWRCLLQWGVFGVIYEGWYIHDPDWLTPAGGANPPPPGDFPW